MLQNFGRLAGLQEAKAACTDQECAQRIQVLIGVSQLNTTGRIPRSAQFGILYGIGYDRISQEETRYILDKYLENLPTYLALKNTTDTTDASADPELTRLRNTVRDVWALLGRGQGDTGPDLDAYVDGHVEDLPETLRKIFDTLRVQLDEANALLLNAKYHAENTIAVDADNLIALINERNVLRSNLTACQKLNNAQLELLRSRPTPKLDD